MELSHSPAEIGIREKPVNYLLFAKLGLHNTVRTICDLEYKVSSSRLKIRGSALTEMKCKQHFSKLEWY